MEKKIGSYRLGFEVRGLGNGKDMGTYLGDMGLSYRVIYWNGEESGVSIGFIVSLQASSFTAQCLGFGMAWAIDCRP